jgi:hypothetical protein
LTIVPAEPVELELWADHQAAWRAWCEVSGQWRTVGLGTMERAWLFWMGLDYGAAKAGLELAGIEVSPETWADLRVIEEGAIEEMNRRGR